MIYPGIGLVDFLTNHPISTLFSLILTMAHLCTAINCFEQPVYFILVFETVDFSSFSYSCWKWTFLTGCYLHLMKDKKNISVHYNFVHITSLLYFENKIKKKTVSVFKAFWMFFSKTVLRLSSVKFRLFVKFSYVMQWSKKCKRQY